MDGEGRWGLAVEGIRPVLVILRCLAGLQEGQFQECIQSRKWGQFPGCVSALFREGRECEPGGSCSGAPGGSAPAGDLKAVVIPVPAAEAARAL